MLANCRPSRSGFSTKRSSVPSGRVKTIPNFRGSVDFTHEQAGRLLGQRGQVGGRIQVVAVQHQHAIGLDLSAAGAKGVAGAAGLLLVDRRPFREVRLAPQVRFDLLRQVMSDDDHPLHNRRERGERPIEDRPAADRQQRLGSGERIGPEAGAEPGGEDDGVHRG